MLYPLDPREGATPKQILDRQMEMYDSLSPRLRLELQHAPVMIQPWLPYRLINLFNYTEDEAIIAIRKVAHEWMAKNPIHVPLAPPKAKAHAAR